MDDSAQAVRHIRRPYAGAVNTRPRCASLYAPANTGHVPGYARRQYLQASGQSGKGRAATKAYAMTITTVSISFDNATLTVGQTTTVRFVFNEAVRQFNTGAITARYGTIGLMTQSDEVPIGGTM